MSRIRLAPRVARAGYLEAPLGGLVAIGLIVAVYTQNGSAYPHGILGTTDLRQAEVNLAAHPAMSSAHLVLAELIGSGAPAGIQFALLRTAIWLDPNDPAARDHYARTLLQVGRKTDGLAQVTLAVYHAPLREAHQYLASPVIPWLLPEEQTAIKHGFEHAITANFRGATAELAAFYGELRRYRDPAELYLRVARPATDPVERRNNLITAGRNYGFAGDRSAAIKSLDAAVAIDPTDPQPYAELARSVFSPASQMVAVNHIIHDGLRAGAEPYPLYVALADAAEQAGDHPAAEAALEQALHRRSSLDLALRLGSLYLADKQYDSAVRVLTRATMISPGAADAWFALVRLTRVLTITQPAGPMRPPMPSNQGVCTLPPSIPTSSDALL